MMIMAQESLRKWVQERCDRIPEDPFAGAAVQPFDMLSKGSAVTKRSATQHVCMQLVYIEQTISHIQQYSSDEVG
jgi:hypothetical protein